MDVLPQDDGVSDAIALVTTVDVAPGVSKVLQLRRRDDPDVVSRQFCTAFGLPEAVIQPLAAHLKEHLRRASAKKVWP
jgi:hypothetical protein